MKFNFQKTVKIQFKFLKIVQKFFVKYSKKLLNFVQNICKTRKYLRAWNIQVTRIHKWIFLDISILFKKYFTAQTFYPKFMMTTTRNSYVLHDSACRQLIPLSSTKTNLFLTHLSREINFTQNLKCILNSFTSLMIDVLREW